MLHLCSSGTFSWLEAAWVPVLVPALAVWAPDLAWVVLVRLLFVSLAHVCTCDH